MKADRDRLNENVRWHYFRYFSLCEDCDRPIRVVYPDIDAKLHDYNIVSQDIGAWTRTWKSQALRRFKAGH
ncbi:uncharacterized protein N7515_000516 [Penicillium bovifimosum]|uniref:Uncharacterized protein n=1 Tax=Penicillium bovifimosum TaxID=126998 RepID=A0A9W9HIA3_9EURO|nr:uncharacterized protein N7515_000516 [Penicillium bovifimosum]KAJ5145952.1 hypothetical protein N7515_000516 [Penicillium bovifimosum]